MLNMAVLAPTPKAKVIKVTAVNTGARASLLRICLN